MLRAELLQVIKGNVSGDGYIALEVQDSFILNCIDMAFVTVKDWVLEPLKFETVPVVITGERSGYILKDQYHINFIIEMFKTASSLESYSDQIRVLLGLPGTIVNYEDMSLAASWMSVKGQIAEVFSATLEWREMGDKIFIDEVVSGRVSIWFAPSPASFEDVKSPKSLRWIEEYATAKVKRAIGRARSKYRSGGLNFDLDGQDLATEGKEEMERLIQELPNLEKNLIVGVR